MCWWWGRLFEERRGSAYARHARVNHVRGKERRDQGRKGEKVGERIVALLSTNRWQTCVHQRAAYRPPPNLPATPGHIVKYGSRRCTTPHLAGGTPLPCHHPATSFSTLPRIRNTVSFLLRSIMNDFLEEEEEEEFYLLRIRLR